MDRPLRAILYTSEEWENRIREKQEREIVFWKDIFRTLPFALLIVGGIGFFQKNISYESHILYGSVAIIGLVLSSIYLSWKNINWWIWTIFFILMGLRNIYIGNVEFGIGLIVSSIICLPSIFNKIRIKTRLRIVIIILLLFSKK